MDYIMEFIINNESIVMIGLFFVIILLLLIVIITDFVNSRRNRRKNKELLTDNDTNFEKAFHEKVNEEDEFTQELVTFDDIKVLDQSEIKYVDEDPEMEKTKAKIELENLKQQLIDMEKNNVEEQPIVKEEVSERSFEDKQEDTAIISIEEFDKLKDQLYEEATVEEEKAEKEIPISINELETLYNTQELKKIELPTEFSLNESSRFKSSPIISPVYGTHTDIKTNISIGQPISYNKLEEEIMKTTEFLNSLKELRKKLD